MESEDLLKPRIKVVNDFWDNPFEVGEVIQFEDYKDYYDFITGDVLGKDWMTNFYELKKPHQSFTEGTRLCWNMRSFTPYPHLFEQLQWHQDRMLEDMPEYIRYGEYDSAHSIYKITAYNPIGYENYFPCAIGENNRVKDYFLPHFRNSFPATEQEYNAQCQNR